MSKICDVCSTVFDDLKDVYECPIQICYGSLFDVPARYSDVASKFSNYSILIDVTNWYPGHNIVDIPCFYFLGNKTDDFECLYSALHTCNYKSLFSINEIIESKERLIRHFIKTKNPYSCGCFSWIIELNTSYRNLSIFDHIDREAELLKYLYKVVGQLAENKNLRED